ncbi:sulfurtransferase [Peribacillus kribbensis]|uniref:sulfurtransferase n=1 Tax=Peribacillus kribbensis TaxID=356658 RepID=UPI00041ECF41|nr:sulfurtransferase [Peribacillus kribbensis]
MNIFMKVDELLPKLKEKNLRVIDCRFTLGRPDEGRERYNEGHIPNAVYLDLEKDLSGPVKEHGGRHPLPPMNEFVSRLEEAGIQNSTTIVIYDGGEGSYSARLYFMLKYIGHSGVFLLQGGFKAWREAGNPISRELPAFEKTTFTPDLKPEIFTEFNEIKQFVEQGKDLVLIDSREPIRYKGIEEKIDKKAGHIPGALNKFWAEGLVDGHYRSPEEQQERFKDLPKDKKIVVYCGSGVTAAPNYISLKMAGFENVSLYIGSFSDYISYVEMPISGSGE